MPVRLIVNADDFGLTRGINRAVAELHRAGVVTSATLMATGGEFNDAVAIVHNLPTLGVGCHVVLVDGTPVCPPHEIPTLLGPDRTSFLPSLAAFVRDLLLGRIDEQEIAHEARAQICKLQQAAIHVTHVDTHKHTHVFPSVARPVFLAAQECGVPAIRYPFEPQWSAGLNREYAGFPRLLQVQMLRRYEPSFRRVLPIEPSEVTTSGTLGIAATGSLDASCLSSLLFGILSHDHEEDVLELCCHPGYNDADLDRIATRLRHSRDIEREALLREVPHILSRPNPPQLIHYGDLTRQG